MNASSLSIGTVSRQTGLTVATLRYYEEIGLLAPAPRTERGQRRYDDAAVRRLAFVRRYRDFGFSIDAVRELVGLVDDPTRPCAEVRDIAAAHRETVRAKLAQLQLLDQSLSALISGCDTACADGRAVDCSILETGAATSRTERPFATTPCCG